MAPPRRCPVLSDEIISDEILARLPAKSVLGCRRLSRAWAATLSSDDFIDRYHALHCGHPKIFRLQDESHGDIDEEAKSSAPIAVTGDCFPRYVTAFWDKTPEPGRADPSLAATRCHGLVLLELIPTGIHFVYNPSTGQKRALPEGRTTGCRRPRELVNKYAVLGLGYDARARRHKVVRVCYRGHDMDGRPAASVGCEVYVVNDSAGSWRPVSSRPAGWVEPYRPSIFAQGHVYWLAYRKHDLKRGYHVREDKIIVSFSISEESFGTVPLPPVMDDDVMGKRCLTELDGRLCLFSGRYEHRYNVWLLKHESNTTTTWDLYCRIEAGTASPEVLRVMRGHHRYKIDILPLAITDNGRRILLVQNDWPEDIWAYTPLMGDVEKLLDLRSVVHQKDRILEVAVYEESIECPGRRLSRDIVLTSSVSTQALSLVLRLLPERTLRRLMCVCRSWCTMIAMELWYRRT